jgi:hypothetical protein
MVKFYTIYDVADKSFSKINELEKTESTNYKGYKEYVHIGGLSWIDKAPWVSIICSLQCLTRKQEKYYIWKLDSESWRWSVPVIPQSIRDHSKKLCYKPLLQF